MFILQDMHHTINSRRPIECHFIDDIHITQKPLGGYVASTEIVASHNFRSVLARHKRPSFGPVNVFTFSDLTNTRETSKSFRSPTYTTLKGRLSQSNMSCNDVTSRHFSKMLKTFSLLFVVKYFVGYFKFISCLCLTFHS